MKPGLGTAGLGYSFLPSLRGLAGGRACPRPVSVKYAADDLTPSSSHIRDVTPGACPGGTPSQAPRLCHIVTPERPSTHWGTLLGRRRSHLHFWRKLAFHHHFSPLEGGPCSLRAGRGRERGRERDGGGAALIPKTMEAEERKPGPDSAPLAPTSTVAEWSWGDWQGSKRPRQHFPSAFLNPRSHLANGPVGLLGPFPRPCCRAINL